jgi:hypothetical protein
LAALTNKTTPEARPATAARRLENMAIPSFPFAAKPAQRVIFGAVVLIFLSLF